MSGELLPLSYVNCRDVFGSGVEQHIVPGVRTMVEAFNVFRCRGGVLPGVVRFCDCVCDYPCARGLPLLQCPACGENVFFLLSGIYVLKICWTTCILSQNSYFTVILQVSSRSLFFKCL